MSSQPQTPPEVFVSYSHADSEYKEHLVKQLEVLAQQNIISQWHDGLLVAGKRWNDEIVKRLKSSRVILLLISADFLTSVYVNDVELKEASRRYQAGEVTVIPVLVRTVHGWKKKSFGEIRLGDLQALPSKFIKGGGDLDAAFAVVAEGIQKAVEKLKPTRTTAVAPPPFVPTSHQTDYVRRHDEKGRDILERLKEGLAPGKRSLLALWGKGGTGKTRIASEAAAALTPEFGARIVWASAEKRTDFTFSTLLDEIARQLGEPDVLKLAQGPKEEALRSLLAQSPTLVVLDNFETVASPDERTQCVDFLAERAGGPALITSRQKVAAPARNIPIKGMSTKESQEFLDQLVEQTQDSKFFTRPVRSRVIKTAESNPYIMLWMVAQIDEAQTPKKVLDELEQGKGPVPERVFDRSFNLQQVGEDGRAVLLALSLFVPDATREALADVSGSDGCIARVNEAAKNLRTLWLISASEKNERLSVGGLTRSLTKSRLLEDVRYSTFLQRFVKHFLTYAETHAESTPEDFDDLEKEKDNLLSAIDLAFDSKDWESVQTLVSHLGRVNGYLYQRGYWDEAIRCNDRALHAARISNQKLNAAVHSHRIGIFKANRGLYDEARQAFQEALSIYRDAGHELNVAVALEGLAKLARDHGKFEEALRLTEESLEINRRLGDRFGIATGLHQLGILARLRGKIDEAGGLHQESLAIYKELGNQMGIAFSLGQLGMLAQSRGEIDEAWRLYEASLELNTKLGNQSGIAGCLHQLAGLAQDRGEIGEARRLCEASLEITRKLGKQDNVADTLTLLGSLAVSEGAFDEARRLYEEGLEINKKLSSQSGVAVSLHELGKLARSEGNRSEAKRLLSEALVILENMKSPGAELVQRDLEELKGKSP